MSNTERTKALAMDIGEAARKSADHMMEQAKKGTIQMQKLSNAAYPPYADKQDIYGQSFERLLKSKNFFYLQACRGERK